MASGGKSTAMFIKTHDAAFVGKQLLSVWTTDEMDAFLDLAPNYLRYATECAANERPSLLAKIAGVYTIKIEDASGRRPKQHLSLLLLENAFADADSCKESVDAGAYAVAAAVSGPSRARAGQQPPQPNEHVPSRKEEDVGTALSAGRPRRRILRFDLKGIRDRRVKHASFADDPTAHVWHDSEWRESEFFSIYSLTDRCAKGELLIDPTFHLKRLHAQRLGPRT